MDPRVASFRGVLPCEVGCERRQARRRRLSCRRVGVPRGQDAYSCAELPHHVIEMILGRGDSNSPGNVAVRSVDATAAMHRSASAMDAIVTGYRGEGSEG